MTLKTLDQIKTELGDRYARVYLHANEFILKNGLAKTFPDEEWCGKVVAAQNQLEPRDQLYFLDVLTAVLLEMNQTYPRKLAG